MSTKSTNLKRSIAHAGALLQHLLQLKCDVHHEERTPAHLDNRNYRMRQSERSHLTRLYNNNYEYAI